VSPSLLSNGYRGGGLSPGIEQTENEDCHSLSSSVEVKNGEAIPPLSLMSSRRGG
jgi:hypothetical protein